MTRVTLYWAQGCHLCEPAKATAREVCERLGIALDEVDITGDDELEARYRDSLPVLEVDGRRAFKFYVDADELTLRLQRASA